MAKLISGQNLFSRFDISDNGFLPQHQLKKLPEYFNSWEDVAKNLPNSNNEKKTREEVSKLKLLDWNKLQHRNEFKRAYSILSMIANSYVWCHGPENAAKVLPSQIAIPLWYVSKQLGIAPILTHGTVDLFNWELKDQNKGMELDNLKSTYTVTGLKDEEWFYLIMVAIEAVGGRMLKSILNISNYMKKDDSENIKTELTNIKNELVLCWKIILRMKENCKPDCFYNKLRTYLSGWEESSKVLKGLVYEGISEESKQYSGGSAAQSSLFQVLDAVFKIDHKDEYFNKIKEYMPKAHRDFVFFVTENINIRDYVVKKDKELQQKYNECVDVLTKFRMAHFGLVRKYIVNMQKPKDHFGNKGTGGTELETFLKTAIEETKKVKY